jgi:hypothetical protein
LDNLKSAYSGELSTMEAEASDAEHLFGYGMMKPQPKKSWGKLYV